MIVQCAECWALVEANDGQVVPKHPRPSVDDGGKPCAGSGQPPRS